VEVILILVFNQLSSLKGNTKNTRCMATSMIMTSFLTFLLLNPQDDSLLGKWEFQGFVHENLSTTTMPPRDVSYILEFCRKNKLSGKG
jgi:hypothetical protein